MDEDEWPWRGEPWRFCGANGFYGPEHMLVRVFPGKGRRAFERLLERYRRYGYAHSDGLRDLLLAQTRWHGEESLERTTVGTMQGMRECEDVLGPRRRMKREYRRRRRARAAGSPA
ncbi:hypothetical protein ABZ917_11835 [Nonomuraea wenchangensis]